jgi:SpoIID/LytB domain protein
MSLSPFRFPLTAVVAVGVLATFAPTAGAHEVDAPDADPSDFLFTFEGGGWGHGVGMSQYGALGRALAGHTDDEILTFYYDGTSVVSDPAQVPATVRVRLARPSTETITPASSMTVAIDGIVAPTEVNEPVTITRTAPGVVDSPWSVTTPSGALCEGCGGAGTVITIDFPQGSSAGAVAVGSTGRTYGRGQIQIRSSGLPDDMWVVVGAMTMDEYLYGLGEVPSSWPAEALKAQATAGRSYATAKMAERPTNGTWCAGSTGVTICPFDVYASTVDQAYTGWAKESGDFGAAWRAAVDATTGELVGKDGQVVTTFYASSNGGATASSEEIWGGERDYLVVKDDPFDAAVDPETGETLNPNHRWIRQFTATQVSDWLSADDRTDVGRVQTIALIGPPSDSGRVDSTDVRIVGTEGEKTVTGSVLRSVINNGAPGTVSSPTGSSDLLTTRFEISSFLDVPATAFFAKPVSWMVAHDLTTGTAPNFFTPDDPNTRGQIATFLWRFADKQPTILPGPFEDVEVASFYETAVAWMAAEGITTGTSPTEFSPHEDVTRAQAATLLWRFAGKPASTFEIPFEDVEADKYYTEAVAWMVEHGITTGTSPTEFSPDDPLTRGQIATFLWRLAGQPAAYAEGAILPSSMRAS